MQPKRIIKYIRLVKIGCSFTIFPFIYYRDSSLSPQVIYYIIVGEGLFVFIEGTRHSKIA